MGLMPASFVQRLRVLIERAGLPVVPPKLGVERYLQLMRVDKKAESGAIRFVLIEALGRAGLHAVPDAVIADTLAAHGAD
jgi:3-dehydroquinate synthase